MPQRLNVVLRKEKVVCLLVGEEVVADVGPFRRLIRNCVRSKRVEDESVMEELDAERGKAGVRNAEEMVRTRKEKRKKGRKNYKKR